jgi:hypothetical protein
VNVADAMPVPPDAPTPTAADVYGWTAPAPRGLSGLFLRAYLRAPRWLAPAAILACFTGGAATVLWFNPTAAAADAIPTCIVKATTGFDCPGCGGTRAFYYLLHGNLPEAARHHALAVFAAPFLVWMYVAWAVQRIWGLRLPQPRLSARSIAWFLTIWGVFSVVRNLPWAPFTKLYV